MGECSRMVLKLELIELQRLQKHLNRETQKRISQDKEMEVLEALYDGKSIRSIVGELKVSRFTVNKIQKKYGMWGA